MLITAVITLVLADPDGGYNRSLARPELKHCVRWKEDTVVEWRANVDGNPETPGDTEFDAVRAAFKTWNDALGDCASVSFREGARTMSRKIGWVSTAPDNENIIVFRQKLCTDPGGAPSNDSCWADTEDDDDCGNKYDCWDEQRQMIALTLTTYDGDGTLRDADFEFNQPRFIFTTIDAPPCVPPNFMNCNAWDLQNTMTHEIGHALGLDHVADTRSTMHASAPIGELSKRVVDPGTREFTCDAYAKGQASADCVLKPVAPTLGEARRSCGCGSAAGPALLLLGTLALSRRKRRRNERAG